MEEKQIREQIVECCRWLNQKNLLAAADGNISFRLDDSRILITPSGVNKSKISPDDLCVVNLENQILEGNPSGERQMHLAVYRANSNARAVVHAHPPHAVALSLARPNWDALPEGGMPEVILSAGRIPIVPYARPGTADMGRNLEKYFPLRLMILSRHGALSWGEDLMEAYNGMERIEHAATMIHLAESLGGIAPMDETEIQELRKLRQKLGPRTL